jgi:anti-anti-sigma regulatory factor
MSSFTIVAELHPADRSVTILLNGIFREDSLAELEESICRAREARQRVFIDLSEVTLVDRKAVQYFANQPVEEVKLINCPVYLRRWISPEGSESEKRT